VRPTRSPSASACEPYRERIELGLARGRNARAIWQDLVFESGFASSYQSVQRFVRKLRGVRVPQAHPIIVTAPGEDYGKFRVMLRNGGESSFDSESPPCAGRFAT
jgi:transposase